MINPAGVDRGVDVCVVGNLNQDLILRGVRSLPEWGHEVTALSRVTVSSGQAGYLAMALGTLGVKVTVIANVGQDAPGTDILNDLRRTGVGIDDVEFGRGPTGLTVALVRDDGERAFVTEFGSLAEVDARLLTRHSEALRHSRVLCLVGIFMLPGLGLEALTLVAKEAQERGQMTVVDPGWDPDGWPGDTVAAFRRLVQHADMLLLNSDEAAALTGLTNEEDAASALRSWGAETVVVKRGRVGAHARSATATCDVPALDVLVQDAVGAGDAFDAGYLAARLGGADVSASMRFGTAVAGLYCSRSSDRFPSREEAEDAAATLRAVSATVPAIAPNMPSEAGQ
ncbi:MAG: ribokinase [Candidatus Dormibacteraceae bacterium]